jgi:hypothetical protein
MDKDIQKQSRIRKLIPLLGTLLIHACLFLLFAINTNNLRDLFSRRNINDVIEFIELKDLSGGDENALPQLPAPPVAEIPKTIIEKVETPMLTPVNNELPDDFTAEVPVRNEQESDSINVLNVDEVAGQGRGYGYNSGGISDVKLPSFLAGDHNSFHLWFQEHFNYPAELKERYIQKVLVVFMIDTEGNVTQISVKNCNNELIAHEISRVMKSSPKWNPAQRGGRNINFNFQMPIIIN